MDPLEYFSYAPHIFDLILNHLSVDDILSVSLVNSAYYKVTTNSLTFRRRIKLKVTKDLLVCKSQIVEKSDRNYHNLELNLNHRFYQNIFCVLTKFNGLKSLDLKNCLLTTEEFNRIFKILTNLDELKLDDLTFEDVNPDEIKNIENLTKLRHLQMKAIPEILMHPLLIKCKNLKRLSIMQLSRKAPVDEVFKQLAEDSQFKLEQFEICDFGYYNFDQKKFGLHSFLEKSFDTLRVLEFDVWIGIASLQLIKTLIGMK
ncbi:hypothetical protein PVAND_013114 [Polypedilum vanderplanki]|uniref:F-box domain-containing protein n=1 Tax=Polypedilum vanderplanki TaxID=319348 RepID=A0A9J6CPN2_POLVA|nr:hypothetical protein PVAND_013114 [Polypedilum vanderplanki]